MSATEESSMPPPPLPSSEPPATEPIQNPASENTTAEAMDVGENPTGQQAAADAAAMPPPDAKASPQESKKDQVRSSLNFY